MHGADGRQIIEISQSRFLLAPSLDTKDSILGTVKRRPAPDGQKSRQLREQIHSGRLKIKQRAKRVKQHTEYHLAVQIVREHEQKQRIAGV